MRIEAVRLENIRSHTSTQVDFREGFNCLIGGLGAGKTSILMAIDFALFGEPLVGRSYAYLLREGADRGRVTLWITHGGSRYVITRGLRRVGNRIVQDTGVLKLFKDGKVIAEKKASSVAEQLAQELGLDCELFREIMWVRQEKLKEVLDMSSRERQKKLDQLLGLEDFERAWLALRDYERDYKKEAEFYAKDPDVLARERLEAEHEALVEELAKLAAKEGELKEELAKAREELEEARSRLSELEKARMKVEELRARRVELEAAIREAERAVQRLSSEIEQRRSVLERLEGELKALVAEEMDCRQALVLSGLEAGASIEEVEKRLEELEERLRELRDEQVRAESDIKSARASLEVILTQSTCPTCRRFISEAERQELSAKLRKEIVKRRHDLEAAREEAEKLEELRSKLSEAAERLRMIRTRKEGLEARLEDERALLARAEKELDEARMRAEMLKAELESLEGEPAGPTEEELRAARTEVEEAQRRVLELERELAELQANRKVVRGRLEECERRLKLAEEKLARMEKARKAVELVKLLRSAYRAVQPHLRTEVVRQAKLLVQRVLDEISGPEEAGMMVEIGQDYTPVVKVAGRERSIAHLSGGERTLLALAYRIGMGHLITRYRTGQPLDLLLLDEPTESLGREDLSIDRLADAIARLKMEQVIAVSHNEAFAERANHVIRVEKADNVSRVLVERP